jgi:hypothetical protein
MDVVKFTVAYFDVYGPETLVSISICVGRGPLIAFDILKPRGGQTAILVRWSASPLSSRLPK